MRISEETLSKLAEFLVTELGGKVTYGVTFALSIKDDRGKLLFERCRKIRKELSDAGFAESDVFRIYEVSNGYIFDMEEGLVKSIARKLVKEHEPERESKDYVGNSIESRREADGKRLAKHIITEAENGKDVLEVALFSRNSTPRIIVSAVYNGNTVGIKYNSYALRHLDLERVNVDYLIPQGYRIASVEPVEILPRLTGCRVVIKTERV